MFMADKFYNKYNGKKEWHEGKSNKPGRELKLKYSGAPYNFVPLYNSVYQRYGNITELPRHNEIRQDLLSGEIKYTFKAETDIFVSNGAEDKKEIDFYKNLGDKYAVPGSTMRGLIRSNMTILGFSNPTGDIENKRFMFRQVSSFSKSETICRLNKYYKATLGIDDKIGAKPRKVRSGYIKKVGSNYYIYAAKEEKTKVYSGFYRVRVDKDVQQDIKSFAYISDLLVNTPLLSKNGEYTGEFADNPFYYPCFREITYTVSGDIVTGIYAPDDKDDEKRHKGYVIFTGNIKTKQKSGEMKNKQSFYVIPEINEKQFGLIDEEIVTRFKDDVKAKQSNLKNHFELEDCRSRNLPADNVEFYSLPYREGEIKPIFYIGDIYNNGADKKCAVSEIGFTPMLRIFYNKTIHDGIDDQIKKAARFDYVSSIFGFTSENSDVAYKSRVYFSDAVTECKKTECARYYTLGSPRASSYIDYIKKGCDYNCDCIEIRGIKQYWLRDRIITEDEAHKNKGDKRNKNVEQCIKPIAAENTFTGIIAFKNLSADELGLLLWCLKLENGIDKGDKYYHSIGMAVPYGYGRISFTNISLRFYDFEKMYSADDELSFDIFDGDDADVDTYINTYKAFIKEGFINKDVVSEKSVKNFMLMKSRFPDRERIRYMSIDDKEYQNRIVPLPDIETVLDNQIDYVKKINEDALAMQKKPISYNTQPERNHPKSGFDSETSIGKQLAVLLGKEQ